MSYLVAAPEMLASAAADVAGIGSAVSAPQPPHGEKGWIVTAVLR